MMSVTHLSTIQAEVRKMLNSCDLGGFNQEYFLKAGFVDDIARFIQEYEQAAYTRGFHAGREHKPIV
jgi:hypothetical protein